ncbi:MAG: hypothetical protein OEZ01_05550 [Candidatus Heimdallarchaeota archaeon]|nr:hypothetical protein [Candidatus Heimdallarchaeota archaeon]MDH5645449.1 hypothetical protein [Candidatus Heimdallarchaeota archaeon]
MRIKYIIILLLIFYSPTHTSQGIPSTSPENPINANLGMNHGNITGSESVYFYFDSVGSFRFELNGPNGTDFDMIIYDENMEEKGSAFSQTYPESTSTHYIVSPLLIEILPWIGIGSFTLLIFQIYPKANTYNQGFEKDDIIEWNITKENSNAGIDTSISKATIQILSDTLIDNFTLPDQLFKLKFDNDTTETITDNLYFFIMPIAINFTDLSWADIREAMVLYLNTLNHEVSCFEDICRYYNSSTNEDGYEKITQIKYDFHTGLLINYFRFEENLNGWNKINYTINTSVEQYYQSQPNGLFIQTNWVFGLILIPFIPIIRKKNIH